MTQKEKNSVFPNTQIIYINDSHNRNKRISLQPFYDVSITLMPGTR